MVITPAFSINKSLLLGGKWACDSKKAHQILSVVQTGSTVSIFGYTKIENCSKFKSVLLEEEC